MTLADVLDGMWDAYALAAWPQHDGSTLIRVYEGEARRYVTSFTIADVRAHQEFPVGFPISG